MADTGKQSPLGAGVNGSLLQDTGLCLNPPTVGYVGTSHLHNYIDGDDPYTPGSLVNNTCLLWLTYSINRGYGRVRASEITESTYGELIAIGSGISEALGNAKAPTFTWYGPANGGDPRPPSPNMPGVPPYPSPTAYTAHQQISWYPYTAYNGVINTYPNTNPNPQQYSNLYYTTYYRSITQWGWIRCFALQAWNEFNWNGYPAADKVYYKEFLASFNTIAGYIDYANVSINAQANGPSFLKNTYSNIDDLISADITGISKATPAFGTDLINSGKAIDLSKIDKFGLPSVLLLTINKYKALTSSLTLALLAAGVDSSSLTQLLSGTYTPTLVQENQIYAAFNAITGTDLANILIPLNCGTKGLRTLADLLNPMMLFPNSYASLTVPVYNTAPGPTNSKTYYLIYNNGATNSQLSSAPVVSRVGVIGTPPPNKNASNLGTNFQVPQPGFDSYLKGVLPNDIAIACGAFSVSVGQVKNIKGVPIEKFAQVVANIETTKDLPLTAGTSVPTNTTLTNGGLQQTAFGSGPNGSWVMSDFLGCMSGLPYPWKDIQNDILRLQTTKLVNIYQELYLAITWEAAELSVSYTTHDDGSGGTLYHVTGVSITNPGYGYHRGTAPVPTIQILGGSGATAIVTSMGTDPNDLSTYGRITGVALTSSGSDVYTAPSVTIDTPPNDTLPVNSDGSKSTSGANKPAGSPGFESPMETAVLDYIAQANAEIQSIKNNHPDQVSQLNKNWNITGTQLTIEQHARDIALHPVPTPKDNRLNVYPVTIHAYIDALPSYSKKTEPHMYAQTIDAISDKSTPGGQSQIAQQRAERNQQRLVQAGIPLDESMGGAPIPLTTKILMGNGTTSVGAPNQGVPAGNATFTTPANQETTGAQPQGYFDPVNNAYVNAPMQPSTMLGSIPNNADPGQDLAGPNITQVPNPINPIAGSNPIGPGTILPLGQPIVPGSLAGNPYQNLIPPQLSVPFTSGILSPSTYSVPEAIEQVIECNCDCWLS